MWYLCVDADVKSFTWIWIDKAFPVNPYFALDHGNDMWYVIILGFYFYLHHNILGLHCRSCKIWPVDSNCSTWWLALCIIFKLLYIHGNWRQPVWLQSPLCWGNWKRSLSKYHEHESDVQESLEKNPENIYFRDFKGTQIIKLDYKT